MTDICEVDLTYAPVLRELLASKKLDLVSLAKPQRKWSDLRQRRWKFRRSCPLDYCYMILLRLSRFGFVPRKKLREYAKRLTNRHCKEPAKVYARLIQQGGLSRECMGLYKSQITYNWAQRAHMEMPPGTPFCWITNWQKKKQECIICGKHVRDAGGWGLDKFHMLICYSEWCERLYTFYYIEGRSRPSSVRGLENKELRFNYLLSNYIRRYAHEQATGTKHRRAA